MGHNITRAQFLRGDFSGRQTVLRPPWSHIEALFIERCTQCNQCVEACPEHIIQLDKRGYPIVNFKKGECTFCGACAQECESDAIQSDTTQKPWTISAVIGMDCLPLKGVVCMSCADECERSAIQLRLVAGGVAIPQLDTQSCNGCGACYRVCPVSAIEMTSGTD